MTWSLVLLLAAVASVAAQPGRFSDALVFTGNAENDFATGGGVNLRKGVVLLQDVSIGTNITQSSPDVGLPRGEGWADISGWDIKNIYFQFNFDSGAIHFGINCFGICGDADSNGDPNAASSVLSMNGGLDLPDFKGSESFAIAMDMGGGVNNRPDGVMDYIIGYPAQKSDQSDDFPCMTQPENNFGIACFGLYYFQDGSMDQPGTRFTYKTGPYRTFAAGTLTQVQTLVKDENPTPSTSRPDLEWTIKDFNQLRSAERL
jgi:hypothetical protein